MNAANETAEELGGWPSWFTNISIALDQLELVTPRKGAGSADENVVARVDPGPVDPVIAVVDRHGPEEDVVLDVELAEGLLAEQAGVRVRGIFLFWGPELVASPSSYLGQVP